MQEQFAKAAEIIISIILFHNVIQFIFCYMLSTKYLYEVIEYELINLHPLRGMDNMLCMLYNIVEILYTNNKKNQKSRRCLLMTKGAANSQIIDYS